MDYIGFEKHTQFEDIIEKCIENMSFTHLESFHLTCNQYSGLNSMHIHGEYSFNDKQISLSPATTSLDRVSFECLIYHELYHAKEVHNEVSKKYEHEADVWASTYVGKERYIEFLKLLKKNSTELGIHVSDKYPTYCERILYVKEN